MTIGSWHILTGVYPPQTGGVSDYVSQLEGALRKSGRDVHIWCPVPDRYEGELEAPFVHRLAKGFSPEGLLSLGRRLDRYASPRRLLVQYVPHAFGLMAMNLPFCGWLLSRRADRVWPMFHEVAFPYVRGQSWRRHLLATVTHAMAAVVAGGADQIFVSIPAWETILRRMYRSLPSVSWLPIPSNVLGSVDEALRERVRVQSLVGGVSSLCGHFGTYGTEQAELLQRTIVPLLEGVRTVGVLLVGRGSARFANELVLKYPELETRVKAAGEVARGDVPSYLSACDLLVQPYVDGISSRRTTAMAGLALGIAVLSNRGALTDPIWVERASIALASKPDGDELAACAASLLNNQAGLKEIAIAGRVLYEREFSIERTIERLVAADALSESRHSS